MFEGEKFTATDERHCVNSVSIKFARGNDADGLKESPVCKWSKLLYFEKPIICKLMIRVQLSSTLFSSENFIFTMLYVQVSNKQCSYYNYVRMFWPDKGFLWKKYGRTWKKWHRGHSLAHLCWCDSVITWGVISSVNIYMCVFIRMALSLDFFSCYYNVSHFDNDIAVIKWKCLSCNPYGV